MARFTHHREESRFEDEPDAHIVIRNITTAHSGNNVHVEYRFEVDSADIDLFQVREVWTSRRKHWVDDDGTAGEAVLEPWEYDIPRELIEELIRDHDADKVISESGDLLGEIVLNVGGDGGT